MLNKSCELFSAKGHVFSISALRRAWHDLSTCRDEEKKAFLNLWNTACSILIVNWGFLCEWSESGAAEVTVRNENTRLNQHLCHPKAFSTAGQVFPIFLLFPPASFRTACWANACVGKSLCILMSPQKSQGGGWSQLLHLYAAKSHRRGSVCGTSSLPLDIYASLLRAQVWKSYDTWKYSIRIAINIH